MDFAKSLRARRTRLHLTQQQVAVAAGMSQSTYARLEAGGRANPRIDTVERLAAALRTTPGRLLAN